MRSHEPLEPWLDSNLFVTLPEGKAGAPGLNAMTASLHLLHLEIINLPETSTFRVRSVVFVSMAVAAMALSGVCKRYKRRR